MQMQQPRIPPTAAAAYYHTNNITTDHIQQYLDENKSLILKIVESQNSGKLSECAENQARLQSNLMYLAAIADSQPHLPAMHSQYAGGGMLQQPGAQYLQHQQAQQMAPQSLMATARSSMLYGEPPYPPLQQQPVPSQLGMNSGGSNGLMLQGEPLSGAGGFPDFGRGFLGMKQEFVNGMSIDGSGDGGESLYLKTAD